MIKRFAVLILALTAAFLQCSCSSADSKGLEFVTVNGKSIDLSQDKEQIAEALGEDYCGWEEYLSQSPEERTAYLVHTETIDEAGYTAEGYTAIRVDSGEPADVMVWRDKPADMTQTEYKQAYDGLYCSAAYSHWEDSFDEYIIVQADGKILMPEEYEMTDAPEASVYGNLVSMVESGAVQELVIMVDFFDGETCFYCSHQIYNSKKQTTE